ncbi:MAG: signal transduction histidine kinase [Polaribacter sp.]|jgi:signal transduction histidine kinase
MALFNTLETKKEVADSPPLGLQVNSEVQHACDSFNYIDPTELDSESNFALFNNLPQPIIVRNKHGQFIFKNKAALKNNLLADSTPSYHANDIQQEIQRKAAALFQQNDVNRTHQFEIETNEYYLKIHQSLEETADGKMIVIETLKNITEEKINKISLRLLSIHGEDSPSGNYLNQLTREISKIFHLDMVMIAISNNSKKENNSLSCYIRGAHIPNFTYSLIDKPCARVFETKEELLIPFQAQTLFPHTNFLKEHKFNAFYVIPLISPEGEVVGIIAVADGKSISKTPLLKKTLDKLIPKLTLEVTSKKHLRKLELQKAWTHQAIDSYDAPLCVFNKDLTLRAFNTNYSEACKKHYNITIEKGTSIFDDIEKTKMLTDSELNRRKDLVQKAFEGESNTIYISLGKQDAQTHYALTFRPIFNYNKTEVTEVLLICHDTTEIINGKKELEHVKKHYYSLFDNTLMGIGIYDSINKKALDFNDQFLELFGISSKEEAKKFQLGELSPEFQPNGKSSKKLLAKLATNLAENDRFNVNWTHASLDGTTFPSQTSFIPLNDDQPGLFCITIQDLSEQVAHQTILEQKNHELEQYIKSNMQLENLAYSVCHDLKEPLRTIGTFTQIIKNKYEDTIDEKSKEYMGFIINGVTRMNHFVDGLFDYSRIRQNKNEFEDFSLSQLLEFIGLDLNAKERNINIQFHNIPETIKANRTKIKQLFQNLIANAIKFKQADIDPEIKISCTGSDSHWNFSVADNGVGIPEEFHNQIFTLFSKLHSKDQYEGSGIGLALCKEIVEQHQGNISADSTPGEGATFYFSIAKNICS